MRGVLFFLLLSFLVFGCNSAQYERQAEKAHEAFEIIYNGVKMYRQDHGEDPISIEELEELEYIKLSESLCEYWDFHFIGNNPINTIEAIAKRKDVPEKYRVQVFNVHRGRFTSGQAVIGKNVKSGQ